MPSKSMSWPVSGAEPWDARVGDGVVPVDVVGEDVHDRCDVASSEGLVDRVDRVDVGHVVLQIVALRRRRNPRFEGTNLGRIGPEVAVPRSCRRDGRV
jgi:hypothetical protein